MPEESWLVSDQEFWDGAFLAALGRLSSLEHAHDAAADFADKALAERRRRFLAPVWTQVEAPPKELPPPRRVVTPVIMDVTKLHPVKCER